MSKQIIPEYTRILCDLCGSDATKQTWRLDITTIKPQARSSEEICEDCSKPIIDLIESMRKEKDI